MANSPRRFLTLSLTRLQRLSCCHELTPVSTCKHPPGLAGPLEGSSGAALPSIPPGGNTDTAPAGFLGAETYKKAAVKAVKIITRLPGSQQFYVYHHNYMHSIEWFLSWQHSTNQNMHYKLNMYCCGKPTLHETTPLSLSSPKGSPPKSPSRSTLAWDPEEALLVGVATTVEGVGAVGAVQVLMTG